MTQDEILEYNKNCAEFLGYEHYMFRGYTMYVFDEDNHRTEIDLHYHSDWNWIMEVVEAIENIEVQEAIKENANTELNRALGKVLDLPIYTPKKAVVQSINQFLIWYNEQTN